MFYSKKLDIDNCWIDAAGVMIEPGAEIVIVEKESHDAESFAGHTFFNHSILIQLYFSIQLYFYHT